MKKIFNIYLSSLVLSTTLLADCDDKLFSNTDFPLIDLFTNSKRSIPFIEKAKNLRVFGDVRADWLWREEREGDTPLRGRGARDRDGVHIVADQMEAKVNLMMDYKCEDYWGFANFEFANVFGIERIQDKCNESENSSQLLYGSGISNVICLKRAYMGMIVWRGENKKIDIELGRKALYYNFDSRIQYKARADGFFARYNHIIGEYEKGRSSDISLKTMIFSTDQISYYYGLIGQGAIFNILDSGFDFKLSFINWRNRKPNRCGVEDPLGWRFCNGQMTLDYNFHEPIMGKKLNFYGAVVHNFCAKRVTFLELSEADFPEGEPPPDHANELNPDKENSAWYLGFIYGEVKKEGDFSFDCNYQWVEAQAVPDCDIRGIGRGNIKKESFSGNRRGNANFKGLHLELLYAITDGLSVDVKFEFSRSIDSRIGAGNHRYDKFEVEFIQRF